MKMRKPAIMLTGVALVLAVAGMFVLLRGNSALGYAQGVERQQGTGVTGTMGFVVESVEPGSSAEQAGLKPGDVIISIDNRRIRSSQDMQVLLRGAFTDSENAVEVVFRRYDPTISQFVNRAMTVTPMPGEREATTTAQTKPISGGILNGKAIEKPLPVYPEIARAARASGTVTVQIVIDEEGRVEKAKAIGGHPLLQSAAVEAAYQARFSPTRLSGNPVKVSGLITYSFVLQ